MRTLLIFLTLVYCFAKIEAQVPRYVWSLGFCEEADVKPKIVKFHNSMNCYEDRFLFDIWHYVDQIEEGSIVWVHADRLGQFFKEALPLINKRFIVVSGGSDATFPKDYPDREVIIEGIKSKKILGLFLQNCAYTHLKVHQIPIGIDLHTEIHWPKRVGAKKSASPEMQLEILNLLLSHLKPTKDRRARIVADFAFNDSMRNKYQRHLDFDGEDRTFIWAMIEPKGIATHLGRMIPRHELWKLKGCCAFDISPPGNGVDCHRTWESLILGCIVIVKDSFLNPLFKDLPVVIVKSWDEVTQENLLRWRDQYGDAFTNSQYRDKLLMSYWMEKIWTIKKEYLTSIGL